LSIDVLIVGGGGREHALAWKCALSPRVRQVFVAPGNAGTAAEPGVRNVDIAADDILRLRDFAREQRIGLTIVGPEVPLVAGIVDVFVGAGLRCFGPTRAAARLEGSKAYTKDFLRRHGIPTAAYRKFTGAGVDETWIRSRPLPVVVKADGLAAGKGVIICDSHDEAVRTVHSMLNGAFGTAGDTVVVEDFLQGEEASFIVVAHHQQVIALASSQDHKRRDDGDFGPNTGGMGAYSPAPVVTPAVHARAMREVIEPTLRGLEADGNPYTGFLYAGLMICADGSPKVLEFNCRLGDPETQPILARLQSDLTELCEAAIEGRLDRHQPVWDPRASLGVVMTAEGYPDQVRKGDVISGLERAAGLPGKVFHAATALKDGQVVTSGGRVLCVVGLGAGVSAAQQQAYALADAIRWDGVRYRRDIGYRAIQREAAIPTSSAAHEACRTTGQINA